MTCPNYCKNSPRPCSRKRLVELQELAELYGKPLEWFLERRQQGGPESG
jgi:hypothetical protein